MKKQIALALVPALLAGGLSFAFAESGPAFRVREYPAFVTDTEMKTSAPWPLFFRNGVDDMPWIDLEELADVVTMLEKQAYKNESFALSYAREDSAITLTRENGFYMAADFDEKTLTFNDYDAFVQKPGAISLLEMLSFSGFNDKGEAELFQRDAMASYDRFGEVMTLYLDEYDIPLEMENGRGYMPLQTANDLVISPLMNRYLLFNGETVIFANTGDLFDKSKSDYTPLGYLYYKAKPTERSQVFADYGRNELGLMLDCQYGLKKQHNIESFDRMFWEIGFDEPLSSVNPVDADQALCLFISYYLDDLHSGYALPSWMTGSGAELQGGGGPSSRLSDAQEEQYNALRSRVMGDKIEAYQEVGNTAYITFDHFATNYSAAGYYQAAAAGKQLDDTIGLILHAHRQIGREGSPVENVVIDLSNNTGGDADAALFVISWILGEAELSVEDPYTGAQSTMVYRADVNLDRRFDKNDTLPGKHVYCLISPVSFSCGNLVPAVCKASQAVTLIGRTSGGGSCVVRQMCSAWGATFSISGNSRLSFRKNGSFYDIDEGVDPDIYISRLETLYDREKLTDLINRLP